MIFVVRAAGVWGSSLLLAEFVARTGAGLLPFAGAGSGSSSAGARLTRFGLGFLLGFLVLGTANLGLALAGLFHPLAIVGGALALACFSRAARERRLFVGGALAELAGPVFAPHRLYLLGSALGLLPSLLGVLLPDTGHDSWVYHLGAPWQFLMAGRVLYENVEVAFHVPLPFELGCALPLVLGDDRLAKGMVLACFASACAVFAGWRAREGDPESGALGILLVLSSGLLLSLLVVVKSDVFAAALFVAGAVLQLAGKRSAGVLFLGLAAAAKFVYWPPVAVWMLFFFPWRNRDWRRILALGFLVALPSAPWWAKEWLGTGNPVNPFGSNWFPTVGWGEANRQAFESELANILPSGVPSLLRLPVAWLESLGRISLPVLLFLPLFVVRVTAQRNVAQGRRGRLYWPRSSRAAAALVVAQLVLLKAVRLERYILPTTWLLSLLLAREFCASIGSGAAAAGDVRLGHISRWAVRLLGSYAVAVALFSPAGWLPAWRDAFLPWNAVVSRAYASFGDAERILAGGNPRPPRWLPGAPRPQRVLTVGEWKTYRFPARVLYNGTFPETPVVWVAARETADPAGIAVALRRLGVKILVYNCVSAEWQSVLADSFPWEPAATRRWVEFCRRYLAVAGSSRTMDYKMGGYYVYDVLPRPRIRPPATVWFAPGTEAVYWSGIREIMAGRPREALREFAAARSLLPDVGKSWNLMGHAHILLSEYPEAWKCLREFGLAGMRDGMNLGELGAAAAHVGELDLAERILDSAHAAYPSLRVPIVVNQAYCQGRFARKLLEDRKYEAAGARIDRGLAALAGLGDTANDKAGDRSVKTMTANLYGMRADMLYRQGDRPGAARWLSAVLAVAPEVARSGNLRELARKLSAGESSAGQAVPW